MKKINLIAALGWLILGILVNAQNQRFIYEYRFVPDSTNRSDVKIEHMNLDVTRSGSRFYSHTVFQSDSLMKANIEKQLNSTGIINMNFDSKKGLVKYSVTKKYPKYETYLHDRILLEKYKVLDKRPINWNISSDKQKIGEWNVQKAEADFAGRHWVAWFTTEIPIQDLSLIHI